MYSKVYVEIINFCNKKCSFCPKTQRKPHLMSKNEFETVLKKLKGVTEYLYYHIVGEPLMHPMLCDFITSAKNEGFKSAVTTNGTFLHLKGDALIASGVYKVNISIHSFEGGDMDAHAKYLNNCLEFADKASKAGVLTVLRLWNQGKDNGLNISTVDMIKERFGEFDKISTRGARIRDKLHLEYGERFVWPDITADDGGDSVFCYGLKDHFGILCDGTVIPCCLDREGVIALGNIFDTPINDILLSPRAQLMRDGFQKRCATEELCRKCGYARRF